MRTKPGVNLDDLSPILQAALPVMEACRLEALERCRRTELVITAGAEGRPGDGVHGVTSLHYPRNCPRREGLAVDLRDDFEDVFAAVLRERLGPGWDIVAEGDHLHVERDPKKKPLQEA